MDEDEEERRTRREICIKGIKTVLICTRAYVCKNINAP